MVGWEMAMGGRLAEVVEAALDDIVAGAAGHLRSRREFQWERRSLELAVARCVAALLRAASDGTPEVLAHEVLAMGRAAPDGSRGYRRGQALLDALCGEVAGCLRRSLPRGERREAINDLRSVLGPAQVALAALVRDDATHADAAVR